MFTGISLGVVVAIIAVIALLGIIASGYVKAPPDTAYIISGLRKKIIIGKSSIKIPFLERLDKLSLKLIPIDVKTEAAVPTADYINKVQNIPQDVIFFNNMEAPGIVLEGDNRTGAGDGDDERITIDLSQIRSDIAKIVFVTTIHEAQAKRQTFGMVENSYIRLLDAKNNEKEVCRFNLKEDGSTSTSVIFAELFRDGFEWQFKAVGEGKMADLNGILSLYM